MIRTAFNSTEVQDQKFEYTPTWILPVLRLKVLIDELCICSAVH